MYGPGWHVLSSVLSMMPPNACIPSYSLAADEGQFHRPNGLHMLPLIFNA